MGWGKLLESNGIIFFGDLIQIKASFKIILSDNILPLKYNKYNFVSTIYKFTVVYYLL